MLQDFTDDNVRTDIKSIYIDDLCVDENSRGHHIGKQLYDYVTFLYEIKDGGATLSDRLEDVTLMDGDIGGISEYDLFDQLPYAG